MAKKVIRRALDQNAMKDLGLDSNLDKDIIEALSQDQEQIIEEDLLKDIEPKKDTSKEPVVTKLDAKDSSILNKVAKTENELADMIAVAQINGSKEIEISEKMMLNFHRTAEKLPDYFWYRNVMLVMEGKKELVHNELNRKLM